jgi:hypothetical protein
MNFLGCDRLTGGQKMTTVELNDDAVACLKALLDLVHYDGLAVAWSEYVPDSLFLDKTLKRLGQQGRAPKNLDND